MQRREHFSSDEARGEVLQYAKKFLGNPYVWGGTSLTNGCDCSGFAQQIFANFGYTPSENLTPAGESWNTHSGAGGKAW